MAAELWLFKTEDGRLAPSSDDDEERLKRLAVGEIGKFEFTIPRHAKHHRKGMALLQFVFKNQERYTNFKHFLVEVKIVSGWFDMHIMSNGDPIYVPRSIAFQNMNEVEFSDWMRDVFPAIFEKFIPLCDERERERIVETVIGFM